MYFCVDFQPFYTINLCLQEVQFVVPRGGNLTYNGTQGWGNWHLETWKCQISPGLPEPPILGQTIDRCISRFDPAKSSVSFVSTECRISLLFTIKSNNFLKRIKINGRCMELTLVCIESTLDVYRNDRIAVRAYIILHMKLKWEQRLTSDCCMYTVLYQTITLRGFINCLQLNSYITD